MKNIESFKQFESKLSNFEQHHGPAQSNHPDYSNPEDILVNDDLKVYYFMSKLANDMLLDMYEGDEEKLMDYLEQRRMEPMITTIIDQSSHQDKQYYVFISDSWGAKNTYIELESNIDWTNSRHGYAYPYDTVRSSHGYPASYGKTIFEFQPKRCTIQYDTELFKKLGVI